MNSILLAIFYTISLFINWVIYSLAALAYTLFPIMSQLDFSSLTTDLQNVINRLEVFIGIFMLFVVAFNLLQYMVDPDKKEGATSKLITKIIVSLVLLVSSSFVFAILDELQITLVNSNKDNIAQTVLFGENNSQSMSDEEIGRRIVYAVFFNMYENQSYPEEYNQVVSGQSTLLTSIKNLWSTYSDSGKIYYKYPFLSDVFGIFLIIMFITFAIDIGVRNFTLLFLRILFPIVAIGYITPKGGQLLSKYVSTYISTYVQIFVKTFTIYLLLYIFIWFMQALFGGTNEIFNNVAVGDTTKTLLLLLIVVALFMFFTKGMPAILKNIFGIEMDSSLKGAFGKALGLAAAGASLALGGLAGGIMGGKAAGAKGAAKGAWAGIKSGAKAGWTAGNQAGSGKVLSAAIGYGKGMYSGYTGIKQTGKATAEKITKDAQEAEQKFNEMNDTLAKEEAVLKSMDKSSTEYAAQEAKVQQMIKATEAAKEVAMKRAQQAKKINPKYESTAVKTARESEKDYKSKVAAAKSARDKAEILKQRNDPNTALAEYEARQLEVQRDKAKDKARDDAQEATYWDSSYTADSKTSSALAARKSEGEYKTIAEQAQTARAAATQLVTQYGASDSRTVQATQTAVALEQQRDATLVKARNDAQEAVYWDKDYKSNLPGSSNTVSSNQNQQVGSNQQQSGGRSEKIPPQQDNNNRTPSDEGKEHERQSAVEYSDSKDKADSQMHVDNATRIRNGVGTSTDRQPVSESNDRYAAFEDQAFKNIESGDDIFTSINKDGTMEKQVINDNSIPAFELYRSAESDAIREFRAANSAPSQPQQKPTAESTVKPEHPVTESEKQSNIPLREDSDKSKTDAINEKLKNERVANLRAFGDDKRALGAGKRTNDRITELMKEGKSALDATNEAYAEAREIINNKVEELIKKGYSREDAIKIAVKEYNEGK